jgi:hypothetical protein
MGSLWDLGDLEYWIILGGQLISYTAVSTANGGKRKHERMMPSLSTLRLFGSRDLENFRAFGLGHGESADMTRLPRVSKS